MKHLARRVVLFACLAACASPAASVTWVVDPGGPLTSIQQALNGASPGDVIVVHPGTYHERLTLRDGISILAQTLGSVTVDAEGEGSVVTAIGVGNTTLVSGLWFRNGSAVNGGGLYALASSLRFADCGFEANAAVLGGGVYLRDASRINFDRCIFAGNDATVGGGLYLDFSQAQVAGAYIYNNEAADGAAISANNAAEAVFSASTIYTNYAREGATIAANLASPRFINCTVTLNFGGTETFGLRGSGSRIERCIISLNFNRPIACSGSNSLWVGCNIFYRNGNDDTICSGNQGTNLFQDPLFCAVEHLFFGIAADSPATGGSCGTVGAQPVSCPAQGVETAVTERHWGQVKSLYAR